MEDNSNISGPTTWEANEVGGNGENISGSVVEVFRNDDSNDITRADSSSKSLDGMYKYKVLCLSSLSLASVVEQYG